MLTVVHIRTNLIFLVSLLQFVNCQTYVGDLCTLTSTGQAGQCQLLATCEAAKKALESQIYPQTCGFEGTQPVVCCVGGAPVTRPPSTVTTTRRTTTGRTTRTTRSTTRATTREPVNQENLRVGDKSRQKCREYSKYVIEEGAVFVSGSGPISSEECAITAVVNVVGGEISRPKEFPHMALIGFDDGPNNKVWGCGGSLISERFVLTAGHCLYNQQYGEAQYIRLGELILHNERDDAEPQDFNIAERIRHPDYKPPMKYNDIALLKLNKDAYLNPYVRPACVNPNPSLNFNFALVSGWGKLGYTSGTSDHLQKAILERFTHVECNSSYKIGSNLPYGIVDKSQVCAGSHKDIKDTCQGDSGGPLQIVNTEENCMYTIVGITSFGRTCGIGNIPGIYTRVANYIEWIEANVWP